MYAYLYVNVGHGWEGLRYLVALVERVRTRCAIIMMRNASTNVQSIR